MSDFGIFYMAMAVVTEAINYYFKDKDTAGRCSLALSLPMWPLVLPSVLIAAAFRVVLNNPREYWWRKPGEYWWRKPEKEV